MFSETDFAPATATYRDVPEELEGNVEQLVPAEQQIGTAQAGQRPTGLPALQPEPSSTKPPAIQPGKCSTEPPTPLPRPRYTETPATESGPISTGTSTSEPCASCSGPLAPRPDPVSQGTPGFQPGPISQGTPGQVTLMYHLLILFHYQKLVQENSATEVAREGIQRL